MKKTLLALSAIAMPAMGVHASTVLIDFDTPSNWVAGSGSVTSYQLDHVYSESGWIFTNGPAMRQGTALQDGVPGALGTYAWRLRDDAAVAWTATYSLALSPGDRFSGFGFESRRWDGTPSPAYSVDYSLDGGGHWSTPVVLDNAVFDGSSNWKLFGFTLSGGVGLAANQFVVRFSSTSGERIMIDNFSATIIPEPVAWGTILGGLGLFGVLRRRP